MKIKEYGRTELAVIYFPNITQGSAWRKFRKLIDWQPTLAYRLEKAGYKHSKQRYFTPNQVCIIVEEIGLPELNL